MDKPFIIPNKDRPALRKAVLGALEYGYRKAQTGSDLAYRLGHKDDRRIRVMIGELSKELVPIVSSNTDPMGYFIAENGDEAAKYIRVLKSRIRESQGRLRDFEAASANLSPPEQPTLMNVPIKVVIQRLPSRHRRLK